MYNEKLRAGVGVAKIPSLFGEAKEQTPRFQKKGAIGACFLTEFLYTVRSRAVCL